MSRLMAYLTAERVGLPVDRLTDIVEDIVRYIAESDEFNNALNSALEKVYDINASWYKKRLQKEADEMLSDFTEQLENREKFWLKGLRSPEQWLILTDGSWTYRLNLKHISTITTVNNRVLIHVLGSSAEDGVYEVDLEKWDERKIVSASEIF